MRMEGMAMTLQASFHLVCLLCFLIFCWLILVVFVVCCLFEMLE